MTYKDQLKNPKWQRKRLEVLELNDFTCQQCGSKENELHVHHLTYIKNRKVWEYHSDSLICICASCHKTLHNTNVLSFEEKQIIRLYRYALKKKSTAMYVDFSEIKNYKYE